jgi:hypothetical protein
MFVDNGFQSPVIVFFCFLSTIFNAVQSVDAMGQSTRSQGISFTHEMWARIDARCRELKCGRSQYFQMLVDWDLHSMPDIYAHKSDGKWHFFPEAPIRKAAEAAAVYGAKPAKAKKK